MEAEPRVSTRSQLEALQAQVDLLATQMNRGFQQVFQQNAQILASLAALQTSYLPPLTQQQQPQQLHYGKAGSHVRDSSSFDDEIVWKHLPTGLVPSSSSSFARGTQIKKGRSFSNIQEVLQSPDHEVEAERAPQTLAPVVVAPKRVRWFQAGPAKVDLTKLSKVDFFFFFRNSHSHTR